MVAWALISGCSRTTTDLTTPAAALRTYQRAVKTSDTAAIWSCFSRDHQAELGGAYAPWRARWEARPSADLAAEAGGLIATERVINTRIAFVLLETGQEQPRPAAGPFVYFVRESDGWKITTHMDSVFRRELELAIERGEFRLPEPQPGSPLTQ